jgi:Regulated-SNARE-like domain
MKLLRFFLMFYSMTFHVMVDGGLIYLCASESGDGKRQAYAFLNEVNNLGVIFV